MKRLNTLTYSLMRTSMWDIGICRVETSLMISEAKSVLLRACRV